MGSRIMHYCISKLIMKETKIKDGNLFILGGLAPDLNKNMGNPKTVTHFVKQTVDGRDYADYDSFNNKYLNGHNSDFHLGYYFHIISDEIWVEDIYYKKIHWLPANEKQEALEKYYRDFRRLNGKLIDYYKFQYKELTAKPVEMEEINCDLLPELIKELNHDFEFMNNAKHEPLEILEFDEVVAVLAKSVGRCLSDELKLNYKVDL